MMGKEITSFQGKFQFLSNFWFLQIPVVLDGVSFHTVEHAYQAAKTLVFEKRKRIQEISSPKEAKHLGNQVRLRPEWDKIKLSVMIDLVVQKFILNPNLADQLISTKDSVLVEGNWWHDCYWGICFCSRCKGVGKNYLGKILMEVRKNV